MILNVIKLQKLKSIIYSCEVNDFKIILLYVHNLTEMKVLQKFIEDLGDIRKYDTR